MPQQLISLRPDIWIPDDVTGWRHAPNLDTRINTGDRDIRFLTDQDGYRTGIESKPDIAKQRILVLGDSFVEAIQVEYEQTITGRLEKALSSKDPLNPVVVVNTGVGGWSPDQYLLEARQALSKTKYNLVIVFLFMGNDITNEWVHKYPPRPPTIRHELRLPQSLNSAEFINAIAYPVNDFLEVRSHLFVLFKNRAWFLLMRMGLSPRYFPEVLLRSTANTSIWSVTTEICTAIATEANVHDTPVLFVLLPHEVQVNDMLFKQYVSALNIDPMTIDLEQPARLLTAEFEARGLRIVDTTPLLREAYYSGQSKIYGEIDTHFSPVGHQLVADFIEPIVFKLLN